ncbi:tetratricopeptide repeat protein [Novosphingobium sp. ZW T3_23]|uniref:tetratricopeptide repeat protein n=1 Tax=Novosphingobium sp. ZW T3_23 TaxID=3378084 RepID=UPI0038555CD0
MRVRQKVSSKWLATTAACIALAGPALTMSTPASSAPVVQALPGADQLKLNAALSRLGRDPRDVSALLDAGDAARKLGDFEAAIGFYRRADDISPGNARVKAGLAASLAQSGDPVAALPLFAEAEKAGASQSQLAADRGLAYDLVGDNLTAQRYYALALGGASDEDVRMRLAISQAIAGDAQASETTIMPLLRKQDKPGWRTRAFALAIAGDTKQAVEISNTILPPQLAQNIAPYLRYMPRLTRAQQAAAANLGKFPRASEIGHDDARIAAYRPVQVASADANLVPRGDALGSGKTADRSSRTTRAGSAAKGASKTSGAAVAAADSYRIGGSRTSSRRPNSATAKPPEPVRTAPPEPKPTIERDGAVVELPPLASTAKPAATTPATTSAAPSNLAATSDSAAGRSAPPSSLPPGFDPKAAGASAAWPATSQPTRSPDRTAAAAPGFDLARANPVQGQSQAQPGTSSASTAPVPATALAAAPATKPPVQQPSVRKPSLEAPPEPNAQQLSLEQIFADIGKPTTQNMPTSGAVDIRQIEPARPAPPRIELPKPEPEALKVAEKPDSKSKSGAAKSAAEDEKPGAKTKADAKAKAEAKAKADAAKAKKPAPPSHPSRIWVQIGVGRDKGAIAFDWRRYNKQAPALFKGREPYVSDMGRTNRILVGPFPTLKAANEFRTDAKKQGFDDALPWTSPAGQVVDPLGAK